MRNKEFEVELSVINARITAIKCLVNADNHNNREEYKSTMCHEDILPEKLIDLHNEYIVLTEEIEKIEEKLEWSWSTARLKLILSKLINKRCELRESLKRLERQSGVYTQTPNPDCTYYIDSWIRATIDNILEKKFPIYLEIFDIIASESTERLLKTKEYTTTEEIIKRYNELAKLNFVQDGK